MDDGWDEIGKRNNARYSSPPIPLNATNGARKVPLRWARKFFIYQAISAV
jgi:hypothetical protein